LPVGGENFRRDITGGGTGLGGVSNKNLRDVQAHVSTGAARDEVAVALQGVPDAGADGSEASEADAE
jgi:hypothetical protein